MGLVVVDLVTVAQPWKLFFPVPKDKSSEAIWTTRVNIWFWEREVGLWFEQVPGRQAGQVPSSRPPSLFSRSCDLALNRPELKLDLACLRAHVFCDTSYVLTCRTHVVELARRTVCFVDGRPHRQRLKVPHANSSSLAHAFKDTRPLLF